MEFILESLSGMDVTGVFLGAVFGFLVGAIERKRPVQELTRVEAVVQAFAFGRRST
jgi:hypothetical protein